MASLLFSLHLPSSPFLHYTPPFSINTHHIPSLLPYKSLHKNNSLKIKSPRTLSISFAIADSNSSKSISSEEPLLPLLQELAEAFQLPPDYLAKLPKDLRLDLNDAAFDLSNGPVLDECGQELGEMLLNLSRAWEQGDTSTSNSITRTFPSLESSLTNNVKSAFGRRLVSSGRRFDVMGQYGQGEMQRIGKAMFKTGKILSGYPTIKTDEEPKKETKMLKFGSLQVELTPEKAYIGAIVGFVFGFLSWELSQGIQNTPESSLQYANDNALSLAKSLRGTLLVLGYASAVLSTTAAFGLLVLGRQLSSGSKSEES